MVQPNYRLDNQVAVITGGSGGIGLAVAEAFLVAGANCLVSDVQESDALTKLSEEYPNDRLIFDSCDVTDTSQIHKTVDRCVDHFGKINILFNNAAVFDLAPLELSDETMYERLFAVNVKGMFFFMQAVSDKMKETGVSGKIINMSSQAGRRGEALVSHYCATKAAVISYTQSAALALAPFKINVNAISPGVVDTPMWDRVDSLFAKYERLKPGEKKAAVGKQVPLGYMAVPADIVGVAVFLASPASNYITGQTVNVDGGNVMS